MTAKTQTEHVGKFRQIVRVDAHTLAADVGPKLGGESSAPSPHDYFDIALATCKALTAHIYARARNIALDTVIAEVERDDSQERQGKYLLTVKLSFEGALSDDEKQKIHDAVLKCPIHKLMTQVEITINQLPLEAGSAT